MTRIPDRLRNLRPNYVWQIIYTMTRCEQEQKISTRVKVLRNFMQDAIFVQMAVIDFRSSPC